jgi:hypothetical protein
MVPVTVKPVGTLGVVGSGGMVLQTVPVRMLSAFGGVLRGVFAVRA